MLNTGLKAEAREREMRLVTARTAGGVYVDVFVNVHETAHGDDNWIETGRAYRLRDGTAVHAAASGRLILAPTGELLTPV